MLWSHQPVGTAYREDRSDSSPGCLGVRVGVSIPAVASNPADTTLAMDSWANHSGRRVSVGTPCPSPVGQASGV